MSTKQLVFKELSSTKNTDGFVSGQDLAEKCGVSRTAVWKAVQALIKEGVNIEAVSNHGYHLMSNGNSLSLEVLSSLLAQKKDIKFRVFQSIDSTNMEAKRLCLNSGSLRNSNGELTDLGKDLHKLIIIADHQTAGRGRLGRQFYSPEQSGLYLSLIYIPAKNIIQPARMTATAAVAVCRSLEKLYGVKAQIKWVNDIFVNGKKVCGILTEGVTNFETGGIEAAIIGIGINISDGAKGFPKDISNVAGSVLGSQNKAELRNELSVYLATEITDLYDAEESEDSSKINEIMKEYKDRSFLLGKDLEVTSVIGTSEKYCAKAVDITDDAALIVELEDGTRKKLQSGEVSLSSGAFSK